MTRTKTSKPKKTPSKAPKRPRKPAAKRRTKPTAQDRQTAKRIRELTDTIMQSTAAMVNGQRYDAPMGPYLAMITAIDRLRHVAIYIDPTNRTATEIEHARREVQP